MTRKNLAVIANGFKKKKDGLYGAGRDMPV